MKDKIKEMILKAILKKGLLYSSDDVDIELEVPMSTIKPEYRNSDDQVKIRIKAENVTIKIEK